MGLTLTVLGSCGTYAGPGNACSGYLVQGGGVLVWLDAGPGTLANLQRHASLADIDAVIVSHSHPDHWLELPVLLNAYKYGHRRSGVPVYGTADTLAMAEVICSEGVAPTFDWQVIADRESVEIGDLRLAFSRTEHPVETLAVRVDVGGPSLAYSADTGPGWSFDRLGHGIDVGLCEASLLAHQEGEAPHMSARQAGAMARAADVGRLIITHLWPGVDPEVYRHEAEEEFGRAVEIANVNERYDL